MDNEIMINLKKEYRQTIELENILNFVFLHNPLIHSAQQADCKCVCQLKTEDCELIKRSNVPISFVASLIFGGYSFFILSAS